MPDADSAVRVLRPAAGTERGSHTRDFALRGTRRFLVRNALPEPNGRLTASEHGTITALAIASSSPHSVFPLRFVRDALCSSSNGLCRTLCIAAYAAGWRSSAVCMSDRPTASLLASTVYQMSARRLFAGPMSNWMLSIGTDIGTDIDRHIKLTPPLPRCHGIHDVTMEIRTLPNSVANLCHCCSPVGIVNSLTATYYYCRNFQFHFSPNFAMPPLISSLSLALVHKLRAVGQKWAVVIVI